VPVTMRQVAERAGVSIRTVSRVINDSRSIAPDTRARVQAVIDELGYRPSRLARGLVTHRTQVIGLLIPDMLNPYFAEIGRAVVNAAESRGYSVLVSNSDESPDREMAALDVFADYAVDGAILFFSRGGVRSVLKFATGHGPLVAVDTDNVRSPTVGPLTTNLRQGAEMAVEHLISRGCRAVAFLTPDLPRETYARLDGYRAVMARHGLVADPSLIVRAGPGIESAYEAILGFLPNHPEIDGVFAFNDLLAIGALRACRELGRTVPDSVAVVGYDDNLMASYVCPSLTTVRIDKERVGALAVERLIAMLDNPGTIYPHIVVEPELVIRESA